MDDDDIFELAINVGAEDCSSSGLYHEVITTKDNFYKVTNIIEKPNQDNAPSNIAVVGRYILSSKIFTSSTVIIFWKDDNFTSERLL